ncbi:hypothetical protein [Methylococcus geothermalis]|uniref:Uncharacterized protein n=1 Tax=Methylococcus geothermalis TaxID=2681310 RepID=A0A858Q9R3_9GAMM|nr:hypothetical protein [Methylococcus geothermalis]QJD30607.1 hypothetical protein GNH96_11900 [Methylococcus geothermalis]
MIAVELETSITGHHLELTSPALPEHVSKARVIVLYEETPQTEPSRDDEIEAILIRTQGILGRHSADEIDAELSTMRSEWDATSP